MGAWIETLPFYCTVWFCGVAPYVGAWIETYNSRDLRHWQASHPTWVRGLKLSTVTNFVIAHHVAPYVGAWIETCYIHIILYVPAVAPYVGAWIET